MYVDSVKVLKILEKQSLGALVEDIDVSVAGLGFDYRLGQINFTLVRIKGT